MEVATWPAEVVHVLSVLEKAGHEAYLVGGCVRDYLLGRLIHDYDIATDALPQRVLNLFSNVVATGLKHGTVTVVENSLPIEVTTYRIDGAYVDGRHPEQVSFTTELDNDLARRDFTINAMAMDLDGHLRDPYGGQADLYQAIVRTVGRPEERFCEDGLRILRGLRFSVQLNFTFDGATLKAMKDCASELRRISAERIGEELRKIATSRWWGIRALLAEGPWLKQTSPSLRFVCTALKNLESRESQADSWYALTVSDVSMNDHVRRVLFLASLECAVAESQERSQLTQLFRSLAWPKSICQQSNQVAALVRSRPQTWSGWQWRQKLYDFEPDILNLACHLADWWNNTMASSPEAKTAVVQFTTQGQSQPLFSERALKLTGQTLLQLGVEGPSIGRVKRKLVEEVLHYGLQNNETALEFRARELVKEFNHLDKHS